jgi:putative DNA primase/helicase
MPRERGSKSLEEFEDEGALEHFTRSRISSSSVVKRCNQALSPERRQERTIPMSKHTRAQRPVKQLVSSVTTLPQTAEIIPFRKAFFLVSEASGPLVYPRRSPFGVAVQAAVAAYKRTGHMLDAALAYTDHGYPISPVAVKDKKPVAAADKDEVGNKIERTGSFYKATINPQVIRKWWRRHEHLIAIECGPVSGIWMCDVDTSEDHASAGVDGWNELRAKHPAFKTREHQSATGGPHVIFKWDDAHPVTNSTGDLPAGIQIKSKGGYFVLPPSRRKGRAYEVVVDVDPAPAPEWLYDLLEGDQASHTPNEELAARNIAELAYGVSLLSNDFKGREEWKVGFAMPLWAATNGSDEGYMIFEEFSHRWTKRKGPIGDTAYKVWHEELAKRPPSKAGAGKLYFMINQVSPGWRADYTEQVWENIKTAFAARAEAPAKKTKEKTEEHKQSKKTKEKTEERKQGASDNDKTTSTDDVDLVCAADVKMRPKEWVWKGHLLRGALELLTGIPGLGKSQLQCYFVACVTSGKVWPDGAPATAPANVIMVTAEDAIDTEVVPRLTAAGADLKRVFILKYIKTDKKTKRQFLLTEDLVRLERKAVEIGNIGLICIDPITAYMGGKVDSHKTTEVRSQLGPLKDFAERTNIAISAITHPPKHSSNRAIDHFIGSQAFIAAGRIGHACFEETEEDEEGNKTPTGRVLFTNAKYNAYKKMPTLAFKIESTQVVPEPGVVIETSGVVFDSEAVEISADEAIAAAKPKRKTSEREDESYRIVNWLRDMLKDGPREQTEIVKQGSALGYSRSQLRTAREKLHIDPKKKDFTGPWMWDLPDGSALCYD